MSGKIKNIYWDTCVFISYLANEQPPHRSLDEIAGIKSVVDLVESGQINLLTSTITIAEMLETVLPVGAFDIFNQLTQRRRVSTISPDIKVCRMAKQIRDHYKKEERGGNKTISTPDSIHLATSIIYKAEEFHTFDGKDNKHSLGLLKLGSDIAGHNISIRKPSVNQLSMDLTSNNDS